MIIFVDKSCSNSNLYQLLIFDFDLSDELCLPHLGAIENGSWECSNSNKYESKCLLNCKDGYVSSRNGQVMCTKGGKWTNHKAVCTSKLMTSYVCKYRVNDVIISGSKCPVRKIDPNLNEICSDGIFEGSKCTYTCNEGYNLYGSSSSSCVLGRWDSYLPLCNCESLNIIFSLTHI